MPEQIRSVAVFIFLGTPLLGLAQLPPEILVDRYQVEVEQLIAKKDHKAALDLMNKIIALRQEHNFTVPDVFHYQYAEVALSGGSFRAAIDSVNKYLGTAGKDGEFYRKALELLVQAEQEEARSKQEEQEEQQRAQIRPISPEMAWIPGGRFRMGCVSGQRCDDDEHPEHTVRVEAFELGKYEVTFEEYDRFTAATGREQASDIGLGRSRRPVIGVSWEDAVAYTRWLSEQTGQRYRLPTEAEWEYAARAGSVTAYSWGNEIGRNLASCDGCGDQSDYGQPVPVGSFGPNPWGLYDMHGNVREWVQDCWNGYYHGAPTDGSAWESGDCSRRVLRGGSWFASPRNLRSADRFRITATDWSSDLGFRVARTITP